MKKYKYVIKYYGEMHMKKVVGICFRSLDKPCYFDSADKNYCVGDNVICKTIHGLELGKVHIPVQTVEDKPDLIDSSHCILRVATESDIKQHEENLKLEKNATAVCKKCIQKHKLNMSLICTICTFNRNKMLFFFTATERIDFRALVKELASIFRLRIELRQVGNRDEAKMLGGLGICGKSFCCSTFLKNFHPISIKMAKEQNLSLNAAKITGNCGRLMCCLRYEQNVYEDKMKKLPHVGAIVKVDEGEGTVDNVEVLREIVRVKLKDEEGQNYFKRYDVKDIKIIRDNKKAEKIEETEEVKELEKLEAMDKQDTSSDEI